MSADKPDISDTESIIDRYNETVIVPLNIEDHPIVGNDTGVAVHRLDIGW